MIANTNKINSIFQMRGYKFTLQRRTILEIILINQEKHLSAEEIYEEVRKIISDIGFATIYRTLDLFEKIGIIQHVSFGDGCKRYHIATLDKKKRHYHLICDICGVITDIHEDFIEIFEEDIISETGFIIRNHEVQIFGICKKCANKMKVRG
ncbi:Fur family transcriptional regulator [Clostridiaceae bacterium M8S5]|nr:Fur family transcriptional regulator [Clostridiaceae bacterium M8S5]